MSKTHPSLRQLEYFNAIAEAGSFRRAAERLGISQPTLTAQVAALEAKLEITLLERSRTGTLLTAQGRSLLEPARALLGEAQHFKELAAQLAGSPAATFRLGVPPTVGPYLLPHVLPDLHATYDKLRLHVRENPPRMLEERLLAGDHDLILLPLQSSEKGLEMQTLFTEPLKFVVPADHPLAGYARVKPEQISGQSVLTLEEQHHFHEQVRDLCTRLGAERNRDFEGTSLDTLRQMVVMGLGVTFLPGLYVHSELHHPEALYVSELDGAPIHRQHALAWRRTSPHRVFFRDLVASIRDIVGRRLQGVVQVVS